MVVMKGNSMILCFVGLYNDVCIWMIYKCFVNIIKSIVVNCVS